MTNFNQKNLEQYIDLVICEDYGGVMESINDEDLLEKVESSIVKFLTDNNLEIIEGGEERSWYYQILKAVWREVKIYEKEQEDAASEWHKDKAYE